MSKWVVAALVSTAMAGGIGAVDLTLGLNYEFSGAQAPAFGGVNPVSSATPWLLAEFSNLSSGGVVLKMTALNLTGSEFVAGSAGYHTDGKALAENGWLFNIDPALEDSLANLSFGNVVYSGAGVSGLDWAVAKDQFSGDGEHYYDIAFAFEGSSLTVGEWVSVQISGIAGLMASHFNYVSEPGPKGPFHSAAHVQGIGGDGNGSGWIGDQPGVPEPMSAMGCIAAGLLGLALRRRFASRT